jgi:bifunctional DNA-binding transcriptional regulator/antitoxin component of YhaV-PrlF toxin-antitoxin module
VTIPQAIREKVGLLPHTEVEFKLEGGRVILSATKPKSGKTRGELIVEKLTGIAKGGLSTDEIMAMTRGYDMPKHPSRLKKRA